MLRLEFIKTENISEATHWIPEYDERYVGTYNINRLIKIYRFIMNKLFNISFDGDTRIIYGKPYKLYFYNNLLEPDIIDETGSKACLWNCHHGYFVKEGD